MTARAGRVVRLISIVRRQWPWLLVAFVALAGVTAVTAILASAPPIAAGPSLATRSSATDQDSPGTPSTAPQAPSPQAPDPTPPETTPPDKTGDTDGAGAVGSSPQAWADVARGFGRTFTHRALGQEAWFAAMSSWLTDKQAARYRQVPVGDVPAGTLDRVDVRPPGGRDRTTGVLTYDTGMRLDLGLVYAEASGGWLVASVRPARPSG